MQKAMTYVRDGNFAEADKQFTEIALNAHAKAQGLQEAQAYRHKAEYQSEDSAALRELKLAEDALHHQASISHSDRDEETSRIWRIRSVRAAHAGNQVLAQQTLKDLENLSNNSRNRVIQASYQGAAGTLLIDQKKYQEAIAHLEEDQENPFTMELLVQAYYQTSQPEKVHDIEVKLRGTNVPTMEQALVVPAARTRKPTS
jgi:phytoene dehydrogenase-like protein